MKSKAMMPRASVAAMMAARPAGVVGSVRNEGSNPGSVEKLLQEVQAEISRIGDEVKRTAEDALKQAKNAGDLGGEIKQRADKLITDQGNLSAAQQKLTERLEALETRNTDLEQQLADRPRGGKENRKTFGQLVAESDDVKRFVQQGARGTIKLNIPVKQAITSLDSSAGGIIWSDRETEIVGLPRRQMTIRQLLSRGTTGSNLVEYAKQITRTNNAAPVSESAQKPESTYAWERADAPVRTIAHFAHITRQAMDDAGQLQAEIDNELRYGLALVEEEQILKGDGTGENLSGLVTEATAYSAAFSISGGTLIDTLRLALLQASLSEYPADGIVIHPTDWARIELTKDAENRYIFANPVNMAGPGLWGRPVVATQAMDEDEFLVGAFMMAATIYDRLDPEVIFSTEDRDNFIKNMVTARAEERLALAVKRPAALITGDFGNVSG